MTTMEKLEDLDLTNDEMENLKEAFKKDEFKKMFAEYIQEISDPENRAQYEKEITQMENERGMDIKFIKPEPGYVLKTITNGKIKTFINISSNETVEKPISQRKISPNGKPGLSWSIPHLFSPAREDYAKDRSKCIVYDFVTHPDTLLLAEKNNEFKKMVNNIAVEGIEKMFCVKLDINNLKMIKMKYKGMITSTVLRNKIPDNDERKKKDKEIDKEENEEVEEDENNIMKNFPYPYTNESSEEKTKRILKENEEKNNKKQNKNNKKYFTSNNPQSKCEENYTNPKYDLKHQSEMDLQGCIHQNDVILNTRPHNLSLDIFLPLIKSASSIELDLFEERVKLKTESPAKYFLDLNLPFKVDENLSKAKFDKNSHKLNLLLPVVKESLIKIVYEGGEPEEEEKEKKNNEKNQEKDEYKQQEKEKEDDEKKKK